jgi:hypothetical protein
MEKMINLADFISQQESALVGRNKGRELLKQFTDENVIFKNLEKEFSKIRIVFPSNVITINKSFFLGWLGTRIIELKPEEFRQLYVFDTNDHIKEKISEFIDAAIFSATPEEIFNF